MLVGDNEPIDCVDPDVTRYSANVKRIVRDSRRVTELLIASDGRTTASTTWVLSMPPVQIAHLGVSKGLTRR